MSNEIQNQALTKSTTTLPNSKLDFLKPLTSNIQKINNAMSQLKIVENNVDDFEVSLIVGHYLIELKNSVNEPMLAVLRGLQNTSAGFLTDKKEGYPDEVLKNCIIEALVYGIKIIGNEFNILGGRFYVTKNGFDRLVHSKQDLEKCEIKEKSMVQNDQSKNWKITYNYLYKFKGFDEVKGEQDFFVAGTMGKNNYEIPRDAVLGKGKRKILSFIYNKMTNGIKVPEGELGDEVTEFEKVVEKQNEPKTESKLEQLTSNK